MPDVDFGYFLNRKYAIMQQQANTAQQQADTQQMVGAAQAGLDKTRTTLLPKESAAGIALQNAQTNLVGEQAKVVAPTAAAQNALTKAQTRNTTITTDVLENDAKKPLFGSTGRFGQLIPPTPGIGGFQFGAPVAPATRLDPTTQGQWWSRPYYGSAAWLDAQNP